MRNAISSLSRQVMNLIGIGRLRMIDDTGDQQYAQLNIHAGGPPELEEVIDGIVRLGDYGLAYCPPDSSQAMVLFLGGSRNNGVIIATGHRESRPRDLQPGEAMLYNGLTGAYVRMCADGKIRSKGDWEHDGSFTATGDVLDHAAANTATMKVHRDAFNVHHHPGVAVGGASTGVTDHTAP